MEKKKRNKKSIIDLKYKNEDGIIEQRTIEKIFENSINTVLAISWYVTSIKISILGNFDEELNIIEKNIDADSLFELVTELSQVTNLTLVINATGLKIGVDEFLKNMKMFYPQILIKKAIVPENSTTVTILKKYTDAVRYNMSGKTIISSK